MLIGLITVLSIHSIFKFSVRRFLEMDNFFKSVENRDFSRWFGEDSHSEDLKELHRGFNKVNSTIKEINREKETQHLYLQKILELVNTGIIAYNIQTGEVLWINDSFKNTLNVPSLKRVDFIHKRKPKLYKLIFETNHTPQNTVIIDKENDKIQILISSSIFEIDHNSFKLIVTQNIEDTLNQNENEAWKKLLRVMTHEIMNSIAPISSLAETLHSKVKSSIYDPINNQIDMDDLEYGIDSIKRRSEGLMKFAETYKGLNKITELNLRKVLVLKLFENIQNLLKPSLDKKGVELQLKIDSIELQLEIDTYLMEQVLINLVLNSIEALRNTEKPKIILATEKNIDGLNIIKIIDNGIGISEDIVDKVFIPFFSTKKNGSGIGLNVCKEIMLLHKGKIQVKSIENKGTVISLVFLR